ncbi:MAG TPA: AAA family ATPase [Solirubrobacteraceae bacterium]|nr:AAA family ATPase [Solirubrobacteraceae bacterium]
MSELSRMLSAVRSEATGRLVWLGGEAGVGKTALLRRFCELQSRRVRALWGRCEPLRTPRPLGPFVDIAESVGGELAELVQAAARPHEVCAGLLRELRRRGPTVLVLEDLNWADEATLDVVALLAGRIASAPALVLASYRDDELERRSALRVLLGQLAPGPRRLKIERLSPAAVAALAEPHGLDGSELYGRTGGNPFFVTEVLAAGGERLPDTVRDAVLARAARLSEPAQRLLDVVAIVPGHSELSLLEEVAGELVSSLDECLGAGMLAVSGTAISFRHELARLAIEETISPAGRLELHRAALAALERTAEPDAARLADHADGAGDAQAVLEWAPLAGERAAASGSHREAAAQYERALRFAAGQPLELRAELLQRRADECYLTDQFDPAIAAQEAALDAWRMSGDRCRVGDALRSLSRLLRFTGRTAEAQRVALEAIELLEQLEPGHELAIAYANVSHVCCNSEDLDGALHWGERALALGERLGDAEALVYAMTNLGVVEFLAGSREGESKLVRALELAREHGLEEHTGRISANLVWWPGRQRMLAVAARHLEAGLEYCGERGLDTWRLYLLAARARLELDLGRWDDAATSIALVLRDPRSAPVPRGWALVALGLLRARRGDPDAFGPLEEPRRLAGGTEELQRIAPPAAATAEAAWLNGDTAEIERVTDAELALGIGRRVPWVVGELACWRWRAGVRDQLPAELVAEPYRLSIAGDWAQAAQLWREIGCPYESALALAESHDDRALREALDRLQALRARPAATIVAHRLRERGIRGVPHGPRASTRANPAGLTSRELEVVALLAEGLRNAQIAERLFVAEKTVSHHVSAILRKLDVRTRGEASAKATQLGLTGPKQRGART